MTIFDEVSKAVLKSLGIVPPLPDYGEFDIWELGILSGPEPEGEVELVRRYDDPAAKVAPGHGYAFACKRCEVYGAVAGGEEIKCWSCQKSDRIEAR